MPKCNHSKTQQKWNYVEVTITSLVNCNTTLNVFHVSTSFVPLSCVYEISLNFEHFQLPMCVWYKNIVLSGKENKKTPSLEKLGFYLKSNTNSILICQFT